MVIFVVGNLTYADYYTKMASSTKQILMFAFGISFGMFLVNFALATAMDGVEKGFKYGLMWFTGVSCIAYVVMIVCGFIYGFASLKQYFGKKRGKL